MMSLLNLLLQCRKAKTWQHIIHSSVKKIEMERELQLPEGQMKEQIKLNLSPYQIDG